MAYDNVEITVGGPSKSLDYDYKTVVLKSNLGFAEQVGEENVKYVVKWNFDLGGETVEMPARCILHFEGGVITNGTLVGNDTYIGGDKNIEDNITRSVILSGIWKRNVGVNTDDTLSTTSTNPVENRVVTYALGERVNDVRYEYTEDESGNINYGAIKQSINGTSEIVINSDQLKALLGINNSVNKMFSDFEDWISTVFANYNKSIQDMTSAINSNTERIVALENQPGPGPEPSPWPSIDSEDEFADLIAAFNTLSPINNAITQNGVVYNYLKKFYDEAYSQWVNDSSVLFKETTYPEIENYRNINGVKGTNTGVEYSYYYLAFRAMSSWLMAMCLTELKPSKDTTGALTNYQTLYFLTAYNYGAPLNSQNQPDGRLVKLYNDYHIHCDPMVARLAAGAVYARVRSGKMLTNGTQVTATDVVNARTALGGSTISGEEWGSLGFSDTQWFWTGSEYTTNSQASGAVRCGWIINMIGYCVNTNQIFPSAPGPRVPNSFAYGGMTVGGTEINNPLPSVQCDDAESFNPDTNNYLVDEAIYNEVVRSYNMGSQTTRNEWDNMGQNKQQRLIQVGATPENTKMYMFGAEQSVAFNGIVQETNSALIPAGYNSNNYNRYSFSKSSSTNLSIKGPFYMHSGLWSFCNESDLERIATARNKVPQEKYIRNMLDIADKMRYPTYSIQYGRRRPGTALNLYGKPGISTTPADKTNEIYNRDLSFLVADDQYDKNAFSQKADVASDRPTSYPSGHSSQIWAMAMALTQMNPDNMENYMKNAYAYSVNRSIGRFHWNSDIIYGRLFGTITLPIVNAMSDLADEYNAAKNIVINGSIGTTGVSMILWNNSGSTIQVQNRARCVLNDNGTMVRNQLYFSSNPNELVEIPNGQSHKFTVASYENNTPYYNLPFAPNSMLGDNPGNIMFYDANSVSQTYKMPMAGTDIYFANGATYTIDYRGNSSGSSDNIKIIVTNKSTSDVIIKDKITFRLTWDGVPYSDLGPMLVNNGESPRTLHPQDYVEFDNISVQGLGKWLGKHFCSREELIQYGFNPSTQVVTNVSIYDGSSVTTSLNTKPISTSETFRGGAIYHINIGGSEDSTVEDTGEPGIGGSVSVNYNGNDPDNPGIPEGEGTMPSMSGGSDTPLPYESPVTGTVTIVNESGSDLTITNRVWFMTYGTYRTETTHFRVKGTLSGDGFTIPNLGQKTYNLVFSVSENEHPAIAIGMHFANSGQWGYWETNNAFYLDSNSYYCIKFDPSWVFKNGASYTMVIPSGTHEVSNQPK